MSTTPRDLIKNITLRFWKEFRRPAGRQHCLLPKQVAAHEFEPPPHLHRSPGEPEWPLRVIIIGHNPSEKAWELGHYYGNPSNRMWKLLSAAGIVPPNFTASNDDDCPITCGVGFTDVVCVFSREECCRGERTERAFGLVDTGGGQRLRSCTSRVVRIVLLACMHATSCSHVRVETAVEAISFLRLERSGLRVWRIRLPSFARAHQQQSTL